MLKKINVQLITFFDCLVVRRGVSGMAARFFFSERFFFLVTFRVFVKSSSDGTWFLINILPTRLSSADIGAGTVPRVDGEVNMSLSLTRFSRSATGVDVAVVCSAVNEDCCLDREVVDVSGVCSDVNEDCCLNREVSTCCSCRNEMSSLESDGADG